MVIAIIAVLIALFAAVQAAREAARRAQCTTTSSRSAWPCTITRAPTGRSRRARRAAAGGRGTSSSSPSSSRSTLYNAWNSFGSNVPSGGAADGYLRYPGAANTTVSNTVVNAYGCPSDPNAFADYGNGLRMHNYVVNYGNADQAQNANYPVPSPQNPNRVHHVHRGTVHRHRLARHRRHRLRAQFRHA